MSDERFLDEVRHTLEASVAQLDEDTRRRLAAARRAALDERPEEPWNWHALVSAAALASVVVGLIVVLLPQEPSLTPAMEDLEILSSTEDLDFYDELDFYSWLAESEADATAG
jgi:hypothetical protein